MGTNISFWGIDLELRDGARVITDIFTAWLSLNAALAIFPMQYHRPNMQVHYKIIDQCGNTFPDDNTRPTYYNFWWRGDVNLTLKDIS